MKASRRSVVVPSLHAQSSAWWFLASTLGAASFACVLNRKIMHTRAHATHTFALTNTLHALQPTKHTYTNNLDTKIHTRFSYAYTRTSTHAAHM